MVRRSGSGSASPVAWSTLSRSAVTPNALSTLVSVERVVTSEVDTPTVSSSTSRRCRPSRRALVTTSAARPGIGTARVSKNSSCATGIPAALSAPASTVA